MIQVIKYNRETKYFKDTNTTFIGQVYCDKNNIRNRDLHVNFKFSYKLNDINLYILYQFDDLLKAI